MFALGCSTKKNRPINKAYHSLVSSYNVLFNGSSSLQEGLSKVEEDFEENFWEILPIEKITLSDDIITVDGIENPNFLKGELKAAKTVQKHSMSINGNQYNPKIAKAYMLLGKARYLDQRFVPALDAFNQVQKQKSKISEINESKIWIAKCNIRLEQEGLAIDNLKKLIENSNLTNSNLAHANSVMSMALFQLGDENEAQKSLKIAANLDSNNKTKSRYLYIIGQLFENNKQIDSANLYFKKVANYKRKIPRDLLINSKLKNILFDKKAFETKQKDISRLIDNYENEEFLDKIYFTYSTLLFDNQLIEEGINNLNKSINLSNDSNLLFRAYKKLANFYFQKPDYVLAENYLDSTLKNLNPKSKIYWEVERQKKGLNQVVELEKNIDLYDSLIKISGYSEEKLNKLLKSIENPKKPVEAKNRSSQISFNQSPRKSNFYFYNKSLVDFGEKSFKSTWGSRTKGTFWRDSGESLVSLNTETKEKDNLELIDDDIQVSVSTDLLSQIPRTKVQKDSILNLKNRSILRLSEIYLTKYNDYVSSREKVLNLIASNNDSDLIPEALYILYKIYKAQDDIKQNEVRNQILSNYNETKFSKILENPNNLIIAKDELYNKLDSLQNIFYDQKFEEVISGVDKNLLLTDDSEIAFNYELLRSKAIGRMEGIIKYEQELQKIIKKYPSNEQTKELKSIVNQIVKKWVGDIPKTSSGKYLIIIATDSENGDELKKQLFEETTFNTKKIHVDRYNYKTSLVVLSGFDKKEDANEIIKRVNQHDNKLKNNFVVLSSQYKNILIYKTLDKYLEEYGI